MRRIVLVKSEGARYRRGKNNPKEGSAMHCQDVAANSVQPWVQEHDELRALMGHAWMAFTEPTQSAAELAALVAQLAEKVSTHFQNEESGGYFADLLTEAPRFHARVEALVHQHAQLLELLEALRRRVIAGARSQASWLEAKMLFNRFLREFEEHESAELGLIQEACSDDLGEGD
jgi:hemerythrin